MRRDELYLVASGVAPVVQQLSSESCMRVNAPRIFVDGGKCIAHGSAVVVGVAGVRGMMVDDGGRFLKGLWCKAPNVHAHARVLCPAS